MKRGWLALEAYSPCTLEMVEAPRIWKSGKAFGLLPALRFSICMNDGSMFLRLWSTLELPTRWSSSPLTVVTAPVKVFAFRVKVPLTTTSSTAFASGLSTMCMFEVARTFCCCMPMEEMTSRAPRGHLLNENLPLTSVTVTSFVPMILMVAPMTGNPSSDDVIVPVMPLRLSSYASLCSRKVTFTRLPSLE